MESDCLNCDIGFYCTTHCIQVWCMLQQFCLLVHQSLSEWQNISSTCFTI